jgi:hypothetical protein
MKQGMILGFGVVQVSSSLAKEVNFDKSWVSVSEEET